MVGRGHHLLILWCITTTSGSLVSEQLWGYSNLHQLEDLMSVVAGVTQMCSTPPSHTSFIRAQRGRTGGSYTILCQLRALLCQRNSQLASLELILPTILPCLSRAKSSERKERILAILCIGTDKRKTKQTYFLLFLETMY